MRVIKTVSEMQKVRQNFVASGKTIGFVPTMGALHEGHISLIRRSKKENNISVVSIFINPTQFSPHEDYKKYPRTIEKDKKIAEKEGIDIIFMPGPEGMYPKGYLTYVNVNELSTLLCGISRPGHFNGVCTIVLKLFNIINPTRAYFGQKDYQQFMIIKKMSDDLNMKVKLIMMPIIRESDGLAMSSRNKYLSVKERGKALSLIEALSKAEEMIKVKNEKNPKRVINQMKLIIDNQAGTKIDYIKICNVETLKEVKNIEDRIVVALAVRIGKTRLIDNVIIRVC